MATAEQIQEFIGVGLWEVQDVQPRRHGIELKEPDDRDKLFLHLEKVRGVADSAVQLHGFPWVDGCWHAAKALLGVGKFRALEEMYADNRDDLTDEAVALAILSAVTIEEESVFIAATDALTAGAEALAERFAPKGGDQIPSSHAVEMWETHTKLGWLMHLPTELTIVKLGSWETDELFCTRIKYTVDLLAMVFPDHPDDIEEDKLCPTSTGSTDGSS
jgi:hypothetical protein